MSLLRRESFQFRWLTPILIAITIPHVADAQAITSWAAIEGKWFDVQNWTNGIPDSESLTIVASGFVQAESGSVPVSTAGLTIGTASSGPADAIVEVVKSILNVNGPLNVAQSTGGDVSGVLNTQGGEKLIGDLAVLGSIHIGSVDDDRRSENARATGKLVVGGDVSIGQGTNIPTFNVGTLRATGDVDGLAEISGNLGSESSGYDNVIVGHIGQGADGSAVGELQATSVFGAGKSASLVVGSNFGSGHAVGHMGVSNDIAGFGFVQIGVAGAGGTASGSLEYGGQLIVDAIEVGEKSGQGHGRLTMLADATLSSEHVVVYPGSQLDTMNVVEASISNLGLMSIADNANEEQSRSVEMTGDFTQSSSGVIRFDVRGPEAGKEYDVLQVGGLANVSGRFDIRFDDQFEAKLGQTFEFVTAKEIENTRLDFSLFNPPKDLALRFNADQGLIFEFVTPTSMEFQSKGVKFVDWSDKANWVEGIPPSSEHQVDLFNEFDFAQTVLVRESGVAQRLSIGGVSPVHFQIGREATFTATHSFNVERGSTLTLDQAALRTANLQLQRGAGFFASGLVVGDVRNGGLLQIGDDKLPGILEIEGDFNQIPGGIIELDIFGLDAGQYDQIVVDGTSNVGGTLLINLPADFDVGAGFELPLFTALDGLFGNFDIRVFGAEFLDNDLIIQQTGSTIMFSSGDEFTLDDLGDMNDDGIRDEVDIAGFALAMTDISDYLADPVYKGIYPRRRADANFDFEMDLDDIEPFLACVRDDNCGFENLAVVPEPNAMSLSVISFGWLCATLRRRRRKETCNAP